MYCLIPLVKEFYWKSLCLKEQDPGVHAIHFMNLWEFCWLDKAFDNQTHSSALRLEPVRVTLHNTL